ncbi:MAG: NAD(P)H-hydrate dehydratase [Bacteroidetes bacterium]|nr:NAD(P)H-hydrate dehydratase [Bacteroidota bacterium]
MSHPAKIFSVQQIRRADQYTILHEPVLSIDLMERAAMACKNWMTAHYTKESSFIIFCGTGNNGGDGLAIARLLLAAGYRVQVFVAGAETNATQDFLTNQKRLDEQAISLVRHLHTVNDFPVLPAGTILIDALFGTGLSRAPEGLLADLIRYINAATATVIAIDIPSGLLADQHSDPSSAIIQANYTLSFQFPKLAFFFPENGGYVGEWVVLDIGLSQKFIEEEPSSTFFITKDFIKTLLHTRPKFSHKGSFGHALLVTGSYGKMGAALLATDACLRSGVGLLTVHTPVCGYEILQTTHPEAMATVDSGEQYNKDEIQTDAFNAVGIGPGLGTHPDTQNAVRHLLTHCKRPVVIDADALNSIGKQKEGEKTIPAHAILTPHLKEFARLAGETANDFSRYELQLAFSQKYQVYLVLKGAHTCITTPEGETYFNTSGNPGMARGGSGDVLTGMLTSLLAQGYSQKETCLLGVFLHGLAGDLAKQHLGEMSMLAGDLVRYLPQAFISLQEN